MIRCRETPANSVKLITLTPENSMKLIHEFRYEKLFGRFSPFPFIEAVRSQKKLPSSKSGSAIRAVMRVGMCTFKKSEKRMRKINAISVHRFTRWIEFRRRFGVARFGGWKKKRRYFSQRAENSNVALVEPWKSRYTKYTLLTAENQKRTVFNIFEKIDILEIPTISFSNINSYL